MEDQLLVDVRERMNRDTSRGKAIAERFNVEVVAECSRDAEACRFKWKKMIQDYKKMSNYNKQSGHDEKNHFHL